MHIETIRKILSEEGFRPDIDEDGDLVFKYEGSVYFLEVDDEDEFFMRLVLPNFWEIESEEERALVSQTALETTTMMKVAKVFPVNDQVHASAELFLPSEESITPILGRLLDVVSGAAGVFADSMREAAE